MFSVAYQMPGRVKLYLLRSPLLLESDRIEWKPANLSDVVLGGIIIIRYVKEMDQMSMIQWNSSGASIC